MVRLLPLILTVLIAVTSLSPKRSFAAAGLLTGNPHLAVAGVLTIYPGANIAMWMRDRQGDQIGGVMWGFILFFVGITLLDVDSNGNIQFFPIEDGELVADVGLNSEELASYNSYIEELELIFNQISVELAESESVAESERLWRHYGQLVPESALSALHKVFSYQVR